MSTTVKPISAFDSVRIDKELASIPDIVSKYDTYFYSKDQLQDLHDMQDEINAIFERIFNKHENQ